MRLISKVIVGAAVAGACGYAAAATITVATQDNVSRQGALASTASAVVNVAPTVVIQDTYVNLDAMRFTTSATFGSVVNTGVHSASFICSGTGGASVVFSYSEAASTTSLLVYTAGNPAVNTAGMSCSVPSIGIRAGSLTTAGTYTLSVEGRKATTAAVFDTSAARVVLSVVDQFAIAVNNQLNGVINVQSSRLSFQTDDTSVAHARVTSSGDVFEVSLTRVENTNLSVTAGTLVVTLTAGSSFGFLQEPDGQTGAGSCSLDLGSGQAGATAVNIVGGTLVASPTSGACNVLTATFNSVATGRYAIVLGRNGASTSTNASVFQPQSYTAAASATAGTVSLATIASGTAAGSWALNGTTVNIPYVPISSSINLSVLMANRSAQTGTVTFTAWNASGTSCTGTLGTINPTSQGSFGSSLRAALQACTGTGWAGASGAVVQLLATTPSADTEVHSAFTTSDGASRQVLINSTQGRGN